MQPGRSSPCSVVLEDDDVGQAVEADAGRVDRLHARAPRSARRRRGRGPRAGTGRRGRPRRTPPTTPSGARRGGPGRARPGSRAGSAPPASGSGNGSLRSAIGRSGRAATARRRSAYCAAIASQAVAPRRRCGRRRRGGRPRRGRRRARAGSGRGRRRRARASTAGRPSAGGRPRRDVVLEPGRRDPPARVLAGQNSSVGPPPVTTHRQAAGHRLEHRHREALAAVRVDEHVAGAVQRGQALAVEVVGQVDDPRQRVAVLAEQRARGAHVAVEGAGADVLDHQGHVVATGERLARTPSSSTSMPLREIVPPTNRSAQAVTRAAGELGLRALGREDVEVDPVRHDVHPVGLDAVVEVHLRARTALGTHSSSTCRCSGSTQALGIAPNSQGWISASRPMPGSLKSGGHWWRTSTSGGPRQRRLVDRAVVGVALDREALAGDQPVATSLLTVARLEALCWSPTQRTTTRVGRRLGRRLAAAVQPPRARRRTARTASAPRSGPAGARPGPARCRAAVSGLGQRVGAAAVDQQAVALVLRDASVDAAHAAGDTGTPAGAGTRRPPAGRSPRQRRDHRDVEPGQDARQLGVRVGADQLAPRRAVSRACARRARSGLDRRRGSARRPGSLRLGGLDQEMRALVRVRRADEADHQRLALRARAAVATDGSQVRRPSGMRPSGSTVIWLARKPAVPQGAATNPETASSGRPSGPKRSTHLGAADGVAVGVVRAGRTARSAAAVAPGPVAERGRPRATGGCGRRPASRLCGREARAGCRARTSRRRATRRGCAGCGSGRRRAARGRASRRRRSAIGGSSTSRRGWPRSSRHVRAVEDADQA